MKTVIVNFVSDVKEDKNTKSYRTIGFKSPSHVVQENELGEKIKVRVEPKKTAINVYEESYLDGSMEFGYDVEPGEHLAGDIITRNVEPYPIEVVDKYGVKTGEIKSVNTFTTVVFGDTENKEAWEAKVKSTFRARGKEITNFLPINFSIAKVEQLVEKQEKEKDKSVF